MDEKKNRFDGGDGDGVKELSRFSCPNKHGDVLVRSKCPCFCLGSGLADNQRAGLKTSKLFVPS